MINDDKTKYLKANDKFAIKYSDKIYGCHKDTLRPFLLKPHIYRSEFSRDRDRILYSKSFRRLSGKTQVFIAGYDPQIRTRLTHTMEVFQISKTISDFFNFNTNLCESIVLGHDVGHPPFGHMGELILNMIMNNCDFLKNYGLTLDRKQRGFKHNLQSIRLLNYLENAPDSYNGLNLTYFTLWGIINHSSKKWAKCKFINSENKCTITDEFKICENKNLLVNFYDQHITKEINNSWSFEGLIVGWADEIAQRHHDIEDGFIAKTIDVEEVFEKLKKVCQGEYYDIYDPKFREVEEELRKSYPNESLIYSSYSSMVVDFYVTKYINDIKKDIDKLIEEFNIDKEEKFWNNRVDIYNSENFKNILNYEENFKEDKNFKRHLQDRIIDSENVQIMNKRGAYILRKLFKAYFSNPLQLPDDIIHNIFKILEELNNSKEKIKGKIGIKRDRLKKMHKDCDDKILTALARAICDYLANMTDEFALAQYNKLYGSVSLRNF